MIFEWPFIGNARVGQKVAELLDAGALPRISCFVGPDGTGKRTAALWFAQRDLCQGSKRPCQTCAACRRVVASHHERLIVVPTDGDHDLGIEVVRNVLSLLRYVRTERTWLVIPNIDRLTESAQNAFLKFLEEPPSNFQLICTTTNSRLIRATLRSRLAFYQWSRVAPDVLREAFPTAPIEELRLAYGRPGALIRNLANPQRGTSRAQAKALVENMLAPAPEPLRILDDMTDIYPLEVQYLREHLLQQLGLLATDAPPATVPMKRIKERLMDFLEYPMWIKKNISSKTIYAHLHTF